MDRKKRCAINGRWRDWVASITSNDQAFIPVLGTEFKEGDLIHLSVLSSAMDRLEEMLGLERR